MTISGRLQKVLKLTSVLRNEIYIDQYSLAIRMMCTVRKLAKVTDSPRAHPAPVLGRRRPEPREARYSRTTRKSPIQ